MKPRCNQKLSHLERQSQEGYTAADNKLMKKTQNALLVILPKERFCSSMTRLDEKGKKDR